MVEDNPHSSGGRQTPPRSREDVPCFLAADLFGSSSEILIQHIDKQYRLRITRNGKLILTK
jgi:hemin uptake protein HemP